MKNSTTSKRTARRGLAVAGAALASAALVAGAALPSYAAPAKAVPAKDKPGHAVPVAHSVPFTAAAVTPAATGRVTVSWNAPGVHAVKVLQGTSARKAHAVAGTGKGSGGITVSTAGGRWFRLVPDHGRALTLTVRDLGLAGDPNLRDIGGYRTTDGHWVTMGSVYRSQALSLTAADLAVVNRLGITQDFDLRTTAEVTASPDVVPAGAKYIRLNVIGDSGSASIPTNITAAQAAQYMEQGERAFVTDAGARAAFGALLTDIAGGKGAALYHCTAGKDRTGWATAVILTLLGVDQDTVTQDYLLSNTYFFDSPAVQAQLAAMPPAMAAVYTPFMRVEASYLKAGFDQVKTSYGSMQAYARKGLGLSPKTIEKLRQRLLTEGH